MIDATSFLPATESPVPVDPAALVAVAFLAKYPNKNTYDAYFTDLKIYFAWCARVGVHPLEVTRAHLQAFVHHLQVERKNSAAATCRRVGTVAGYYKIAVIDRYLEHSPAMFLTLPKIHEDPAKRTWLTRWELGAVMRAAQESKGTADWALITLLGTLGMRVSAACNVQLEDLSADEQGYRLLHTIGKGDKPSLKVLPIPTWKAIDHAADGRTSGPLLLRRDGSKMTRKSAAIVLARLCKAAGVKKNITPHSLRRSFATLALQAGVPVEVVQFDMDHESTRTTLRYNRLGVELHARASNTVAALLASAA